MSLDAEETAILRELESIGARRLAERLVTIRRRRGCTDTELPASLAGDDLVWRIGYYEGVTWDMLAEDYPREITNHRNAAEDPNWRWTPLYREIEASAPVFDTLDALSVGVPGGIVWACILGPRPRLTDPPSLVEPISLQELSTGFADILRNISATRLDRRITR